MGGTAGEFIASGNGRGIGAFVGEPVLLVLSGRFAFVAGGLVYGTESRACGSRRAGGGVAVRAPGRARGRRGLISF